MYFFLIKINDVPLIIHTTGLATTIACPQLMVTLLPLQTVVFSGGVIKFTSVSPVHVHTYVRIYISYV